MTPSEIRSIRFDLGLTPDQFAEWLMCDPAAIRAWEAGTAAPSRRETARIQFVAAIELSQSFSPEPGPRHGDGCCP